MCSKTRRAGLCCRELVNKPAFIAGLIGSLLTVLLSLFTKWQIEMYNQRLTNIALKMLSQADPYDMCINAQTRFNGAVSEGTMTMYCFIDNGTSPQNLVQGVQPSAYELAREVELLCECNAVEGGYMRRWSSEYLYHDHFPFKIVADNVNISDMGAADICSNFSQFKGSKYQTSKYYINVTSNTLPTVDWTVYPPPPGFNAKLGGRSRKPAQIGTSFVQTSFKDLETDVVAGKTICESVVERSKGYNTRAIAIVLTLYARTYGHNDLEQLLYKDVNGDLVQATSSNVDRYRLGLERCILFALSHGFRTIQLLPHIEVFETGGKSNWSNVVNFDPIKKLGRNGAYPSFEEIALLPAARALSAAAASLPTGEKLSVDFALGAEVGLSVFSYPSSYQVAKKNVTRAMQLAGEDKLKAEFGVSFHWNKVCGCINAEEPDFINYNKTFSDLLESWRKTGGEKHVNLWGVHSLLDSLDWLGASGTAPLPTHAGAGEEGGGPAALERSWETLAHEMGLMGLSIQDLVLSKGKRMILSEQKLGGCDYKGNVAPDVAWVAKYPFLGTPNAFLMGKAGNSLPVDPWKKTTYRALRRQVYNYLGDWAAAGGGPQYRLDGAYIWSIGTSDVHSARPVSGPRACANCSALSYGDPDIQDKIRHVNAVANAVQSYENATGSVHAWEEAVEHARAPIPGTKASDDNVWYTAARSASGVPQVAGVATRASTIDEFCHQHPICNYSIWQIDVDAGSAWLRLNQSRTTAECVVNKRQARDGRNIWNGQTSGCNDNPKQTMLLPTDSFVYYNCTDGVDVTKRGARFAAYKRSFQESDPPQFLYWHFAYDDLMAVYTGTLAAAFCAVITWLAAFLADVWLFVRDSSACMTPSLPVVYPKRLSPGPTALLLPALLSK